MGPVAAHTGLTPPMTTARRRDLAAFWPGAIDWDADMAGYCTLRAGGRAEALIKAGSRAELSRLVRWLEDHAVRWRVIGRGSNILVSGQGFRGVLIVLQSDFCAISRNGGGSAPAAGVVVEAGAGCTVSKLVAWCSRHGLAGLEFMTGIPGSVGGAVCMNAGAWGQAVGDCLDFVEFVDRQGRSRRVSRSDLVFSYRRLRPRKAALNDAVITGAGFVLQPGDPGEIQERGREYLARRREKQPAGVASAGSFFKNPAGDSAGRLIEAAGLKGFRSGRAMVSLEHANFIVNTGQASADEIIELMGEIQKRVFRASGIMLEPEVHLL